MSTSLSDIVAEGAGDAPDEQPADDANNEAAEDLTDEQVSAESSEEAPEESEAEAEGGQEAEAGQQEAPPKPLDTLVAAIRERGGPDLSGKYEDVDALLQGLAQSATLASRRNDEAARYKALRERLGDHGLRALEQAQETVKQPGLPESSEYERLKTLVDAGKATTQQEQRVVELNRLFLQQAYEAARLLPHLQQLVQQAQRGELVTRADVAKERGDAWLDAHAAQLYVNGQRDQNDPSIGLTRLGEDFVRLARRGGTLDEALADAKRMQHPPAPAGTRKAGKRAHRAAPLRPGTTDQRTPDEILDQHIKDTGSLDGGLLALATQGVKPSE